MREKNGESKKILRSKIGMKNSDRKMDVKNCSRKWVKKLGIIKKVLGHKIGVKNNVMTKNSPLFLLKGQAKLLTSFLNQRSSVSC